jgi:FkbM family methyltransferase
MGCTNMKNAFYQYIYDTLLLRQKKGLVHGLFRKSFQYFERRILAKGSPLVHYNLKGNTIVLPWTHNLSFVLRDIPQYSHNTARIGRYIKNKYPNLVFIDIGANIGDTVILQRSEAQYPILCIEGDDFFFSILEKNILGKSNVVAIKAFVGEKDEIQIAEINKYLGSGNIIRNMGKVKLQFRKLDSILEEYPIFLNAKMLKIDTDGYDLSILRGARKFLESAKPALFFEYDPYFFKQQNDDGLSIFPQLQAIGYKDIIIYDNTGDLLATCEVSDNKMLEEIHEYYSGRGGERYCDLCVFHKEDADVFRSSRGEELNYYQGLRK